MRSLQIICITIICLLCLFNNGIPADADAPMPGLIYYGTVTVASSPAGAGASVVAKVNGTQVGSAITDASSKYSMMIPDNTGMTVANGSIITFYVNGVQATPTAAYGQGSLNVNINAPTAGTAPAALSISTASLPSATVGTAYSASLSATGGTSPYSWNLSSGNLPAGLSLSSSGTITGTPTTTSTSSFTLQVSDSAGHNASASYTITVNSAPAPAALSISTAGLPSGTVGAAYSAQLAPSGGTSPYTWSLYSGTLPAGLNLAADGVITGTPSVATATTFTVRVVDGASNYSTKTFTLTIGPAPANTTNTTPAATTPTSPASTPAAPSSSPSTSTPSSSSSSGGPSTSPVSAATFAISNMRATTTPTQSGTRVNITVRVVNNGSTQGSKTLVLKINDEGVAQEDVVLAPGEAKDVTFSLDKTTPGTYRAGIDFLSTSFEIPASSGTVSTQQYPLPPTVVGVIFAAGLLAILVLLVLIIRKARS